MRSLVRVCEGVQSALEADNLQKQLRDEVDTFSEQVQEHTQHIESVKTDISTQVPRTVYLPSPFAHSLEEQFRQRLYNCERQVDSLEASLSHRGTPAGGDHTTTPAAATEMDLLRQLMARQHAALTRLAGGYVARATDDTSALRERFLAHINSGKSKASFEAERSDAGLLEQYRDPFADADAEEAEDAVRERLKAQFVNEEDFLKYGKGDGKEGSTSGQLAVQSSTGFGTTKAWGGKSGTQTEGKQVTWGGTSTTSGGGSSGWGKSGGSTSSFGKSGSAWGKPGTTSGTTSGTTTGTTTSTTTTGTTGWGKGGSTTTGGSSGWGKASTGGAPSWGKGGGNPGTPSGPTTDTPTTSTWGKTGGTSGWGKSGGSTPSRWGSSNAPPSINTQSGQNKVPNTPLPPKNSGNQ